MAFSVAPNPINMKPILALCSVFAVSAPTICTSQDIDPEAQAARGAAWNEAIEAKCKDPSALADRATAVESMRTAIVELTPSLNPATLDASIGASVDEVTAKYPRTPPKAICLFAQELKRNRKEVPTAPQAPGNGAGPPAVYRCDADGKVVFSDKKYRSIPCKPLELPGYAVAPRVAPSPRALSASKGKNGPGLSIGEAQRIVAHDLRDPEATKFRKVFVSRSGNVCGQLNSKNIYGAYSGYTSFFVLANSKRAVIEADGSAIAFRDSYRSVCGT